MQLIALCHKILYVFNHGDIEFPVLKRQAEKALFVACVSPLRLFDFKAQVLEFFLSEQFPFSAHQTVVRFDEVFRTDAEGICKVFYEIPQQLQIILPNGDIRNPVAVSDYSFDRLPVLADALSRSPQIMLQKAALAGFQKGFGNGVG